MSHVNFSVYAVRFENGDMDLAGTREKFEAELASHFQTHEINSSQIREAVDAVLVNYAAANVNSDFVATKAANSLIVTLSLNEVNDFSSVKRRVQQVISAGTKGEDSYYVSSRGRNATGLKRRQDLPSAALDSYILGRVRKITFLA